MKMIITGSLGNISKPLAQALTAQGHSVTVVTTDPGKEQAINDLGAVAAVGSVSAIRKLRSVLNEDSTAEENITRINQLKLAQMKQMCLFDYEIKKLREAF